VQTLFLACLSPMLVSPPPVSPVSRERDIGEFLDLFFFFEVLLGNGLLPFGGPGLVAILVLHPLEVRI